MEKIQQLKEQFDAFVRGVDFVKNPKGLYEPVAYTVLQKGKRLRPLLCLLANDLFGGDYHEAKYPALALETAHNFTLIHDDIIDQAPLRRGKETVCKKWGMDQAILSGDTALVMAYRFVIRTHRPIEVLTLLNQALLEICEGQQMDMEFETRHEVTVPEYLEMIRLKTAVLLAVSLQIGALVAGADPEEQRKLYGFGIGLGMAFQLQDDLFDCYSDVSAFGKMTGGDIIANKKTMMYLKALELALPEQKERLVTLFSGEKPLNEQRKIDEVIGLYDELHVKEEVERLMAEYFRQASSSLDAVKLPEEQKKHLRSFAEMLLCRNK